LTWNSTEIAKITSLTARKKPQSKQTNSFFQKSARISTLIL
jgi:hypothetical protein